MKKGLEFVRSLLLPEKSGKRATTLESVSFFQKRKE